MKILFLAPLPPPVHGQSLASQVLLDALAGTHEATVVDLGRESANSGKVTAHRLLEVIRVVRRVWAARAAADVVYLTISESLLGNIKDLCIYFACRARLSTVVLHLHGGTIGTDLFDRRPLVRRLNRRAISRMGAVIVLSPSHVGVFADMIDASRIHIVPNFAEDAIFASERETEDKWAHHNPIRVLYLSAMIPGKGFADLLEGFRRTTPAVRARIRLDFAGGFMADDERARFLREIEGLAEVRYHGPVDGPKKRDLFSKAHFFCLPTHFAEGQPISLLEAYASGCAVIATTPPGIRDIFEPGRNGLAIERGSPESVQRALELVAADPGRWRGAALESRRNAEQSYRTTVFSNAVRKILEAVGGSPSPGSHGLRVR